MASEAQLLVGLDIGTSRVATVVIEHQGDDLRVVGAGTAACEGVRHGIITNVDATSQAVEEAIKEAELAAGVEIHAVVAGVGGEHLRGRNSHSVVAVAGREVQPADVERALARARAIALPEDLAVLHVLPRSYVVGTGRSGRDASEEDGVREPVGMAGERLEAHVHVVTTSVACARNVLRCCGQQGLHVAALVMAPLAAAAAVLAPAEEELGVAVVDIGAGTTDVLVFHGGGLVHTAVLPLGGHHVTSDIAAGLRAPFRDAEVLKQRHGAVLLPPGGLDESVEIPAVGARAARLVSRAKLSQIIEARVEEILRLALGQVERGRPVEDLGAGIVLTGGTAALAGIVGMAENVFQGPVRRGLPGGVTSPSELATPLVEEPAFAAAVGLARFGLRPLAPYFDLAVEAPAAARPWHWETLRHAWRRALFRLRGR